MNLTGIVAEYNPFHNGHYHHIKMARKKTNAEGIVVVMSGNFVQRGVPAIFDKWTRAHMALNSGADLVIELPTAYATASAEGFAFGAVALLDKLAIKHLAFGSENGQLQNLNAVALCLIKEDSLFKKTLQSHLTLGLSFPKAREKALIASGLDGASLSGANDILAIEYLKALHRLKSSIAPHAIKRKTSSYHSLSTKESIISATAIRNHMAHQPVDSIFHAVPAKNHNLYKKSIPVFPESLFPFLQYQLCSQSPYTLKKFESIGEGLENRMAKAIQNASSYENLVSKIKSKRYTQTRIQRALLNIFLKIDAQFSQKIYNNTDGLYSRILGANGKGREIIQHLKKQCELPLITNVNKFHCQNKTAQALLELDHRSTDLYFMLQGQTTKGQDFLIPPVIL